MLLVGLVGYPLMYTTLSTEGSDTFDALSRSNNYVYQAPWNYIWYCLVAVVYGAILVFFVCFMRFAGRLPHQVEREPDAGHGVFRRRGRVENLFRVRAPSRSDGGNLLGGDVAQSERRPAEWYNQISATLVSLWVMLVFLLVIGFGYSYFFSAGTMIYLLMRRKVDETEMDEVYLEEDEPDEPLLPPSPPATAPPTGQPLQMVEAAGVADARDRARDERNRAEPAARRREARRW